MSADRWTRRRYAMTHVVIVPLVHTTVFGGFFKNPYVNVPPVPPSPVIVCIRLARIAAEERTPRRVHTTRWTTTHNIARALSPANRRDLNHVELLYTYAVYADIVMTAPWRASVSYVRRHKIIIIIIKKFYKKYRTDARVYARKTVSHGDDGQQHNVNLERVRTPRSGKIKCRRACKFAKLSFR